MLLVNLCLSYVSFELLCWHMVAGIDAVQWAQVGLLAALIMRALFCCYMSEAKQRASRFPSPSRLLSAVHSQRIFIKFLLPSQSMQKRLGHHHLRVCHAREALFCRKRLVCWALSPTNWVSAWLQEASTQTFSVNGEMLTSKIQMQILAKILKTSLHVSTHINEAN